MVAPAKPGDDAPLGILMLDTHFPRPPGDAGNPATWPFPVLIRTVPGATPDKVVRQHAAGLLDAFVAAGQALVAAGAAGITTTCGFLVLHQQALAARLPVAIAASALLQVPAVERWLPSGKRAGVVTVDAASLTADHLIAAGAQADTPVAGCDPRGAFAAAILGDQAALDAEAAAQDVYRAAADLLERHPAVGAIVLECANMPPYAAALAARLGVPVYDFYSFACWFRAGLSPRQFR